jgi:hypothetical protein
VIKLHLDLDHLAVDTFHMTGNAPAGMAPQDAGFLMDAYTYKNTVLYNTQQVSCGGTCATCGTACIA